MLPLLCTQYYVKICLWVSDLIGGAVIERSIPNRMANLSYREVSEAEWRALPADSCQHAAHAMLYSPWPGKLFGKYEFKYAVMVRRSHTP